MLFTNNENESGEYYYTNEGYKIRVLERDGQKCYIEFMDEHKFKKWCNYADLVKGSVKNPYHRSICGLGYFGEIKRGSYSRKEKTKFINIINNVKRRHEKMKKDFYCFASFLQVIRKLPKYQNWHEDNQNEYCLTVCKNEQEVIDNFEVQNISREEATKGKRNKVIVVKNMFDGSIEVFNSLTACGEEFGISTQTVSNYAKKNKEVDGCIFFFANEYNDR